MQRKPSTVLLFYGYFIRMNLGTFLTTKWKKLMIYCAIFAISLMVPHFDLLQREKTKMIWLRR